MRKTISVLLFFALLSFFAALSSAEGIMAFEKLGYSIILGGDSMKQLPVVQNISSTLEYEWRSADESIATVSASGRVNAVSGGETTIYCKARDRAGNVYEASYKLTVIIPIRRITVEESSIELTSEPFASFREEKCPEEYYTYTPIVTIEPENATIKDLEWSSSDPIIASVSPDGKIRARHVGEATITGKATDGSGRSVRIHVTIPKCYLTEKELRFTEPAGLTFGQAYNTGNGIFTMSTATSGDCFRVESVKSCAGISWYSITPVKAGRGTLQFIMNRSVVGTVTIIVDHSAVYDEVSYPKQRMDVLLSDQTQYIGIKTQVTCEVTDIILPDESAENSITSVYGVLTERNQTYHVIFDFEESVRLSVGDQVTLYGILSEYTEYITETGLHYTAPHFSNSHYNR